ncbi:MAG: cob(I)yrinic acid a,c-diamide adenosyltransferase [Bacteroidota bacterium]
MKIYTKGGDAGETSLFSGRRVSKAALRVIAYGDLDELNAHIGALRDHTRGHLDGVDALLHEQQQQLFTAGALLADDRENVDKMQISDEVIPMLEKAIDEMTDALPQLRSFILPGGHPAVSAAHLCRTVCRRAERQAVALGEQVELPERLVSYLNRLSDYFFTLSRYLAKEFGAEEVKWLP